jgi:hypothetical protein
MEITDLDDDLDVDGREILDTSATAVLPGASTPAPANEDDINRVAELLGRTGGAANHPDGPGVGGD